MGDSDLEEIRKQRLAQLKAQYNKGDAANQNVQQGNNEEQARAQEDAKNSILSQILDQSARARLNTLMVGKPDKGKMVENLLIKMAQSGQICTKVGEAELISLLESINAQTQHSKQTKVNYDRRRAALDSDDDL